MKTEQDLIDFENKIAAEYMVGNIKGPVHLRDGNEKVLINIFKCNKFDIYYSNWASHLHALLAGVPEDIVMKDILDGKSITLCFPLYNFYSSAIVGGIIPIAVGRAIAEKRNNSGKSVVCFLGDMTLHSGVVLESIKYSIGQNLPIIFVVEDNGKSVGTPTYETIGVATDVLFDMMVKLLYKHSDNTQTNLIYYKFNSTWPHSGTGQFVSF